MSRHLNIADRLRNSAAAAPHQRAVVFPHSRDAAGRVAWTHFTFRQLDEEADHIARGLLESGLRPGQRLVLMVRPSLEFIALTFGLFRAGAVCTLIDPGMGRTRIFDCLDDVEPDGFVSIPAVHLIRQLLRRRFPAARLNVLVGRSPLRLGCLRYAELVAAGRNSRRELPFTTADDPAAIIFTSGSTGPPRGVLYAHGMFDGQVDSIREQYRIAPGEIDLPGFPLFALFNLAMQVTTVIPDMDPTRPADVDPKRILEAIESQGVTQAFGSPALWNRVGRFCERHAVRLPTLRRVLSAGAPVPTHVLSRMLPVLPESADMHTPYGATECLPVASIGGREVLRETAARTEAGEGICVGRVVSGMEVRIIPVIDDAVESLIDTAALPRGTIGEIIVRGPVATREYFRRPDATRQAKIPDGDGFWHRMGDVGYFDDCNRLWFCGRKAHIVRTVNGPMYPVCCEAILNQHPRIYRSALVGIGRSGEQTPVLVAEPEAGEFPESAAAENALRTELLQLARGNPLTQSIRHVLFHRSLPVDTRHNVKIDREALRVLAGMRLKP